MYRFCVYLGGNLGIAQATLLPPCNIILYYRINCDWLIDWLIKKWLVSLIYDGSGWRWKSTYFEILLEWKSGTSGLGNVLHLGVFGFLVLSNCAIVGFYQTIQSIPAWQVVISLALIVMHLNYVWSITLFLPKRLAVDRRRICTRSQDFLIISHFFREPNKNYFTIYYLPLLYYSNCAKTM